jgi:hypothetical protein
MQYARLIAGLALSTFALLFATEARAESAGLICMWPDGRPTKVVINYDARTVTWSTNNNATARITNDTVSWEIPGETNFSFNRHSSKIRITGWGGLRNTTNDYACTKTSP